MSYIAHAAIKLKNDESPNEKNKWHIIKQNKGIQYQWKFCENHTYHVIAGIFDDPYMALNCAKQVFVTMFYSFAKGGFEIENAGTITYGGCICKNDDITIDGYEGDEKFFFWNKHYQGGEIGPGVFEITDSLDEFDEYRFFNVTLSVSHESDLNFTNVDDYYFTYCQEAQSLFNTILLAENSSDYGMKMTIYCGILEHLSENKQKEQDVINTIEDLINNVKQTDLSQKNKDSLIGFLRSGENISARGKCMLLCKKYSKPTYGGYTCKKIIDEAYGIRSAFSHGYNCDNMNPDCSAYIKYIVLDVIKNYMKEKESKYQQLASS